MNSITIIIPGERPMSWNEMYSGGHWSKRSKEKNRVKMLVRAHMDPNVRPFQLPVDITVTTYFGQRPLDADNIADKFYIDALCGWYITDDTRQFVRSAKTISELDKKNPRIEIEIMEAT
jgi:Holliday junction resolvase RusA-like endonuclease